MSVKEEIASRHKRLKPPRPHLCLMKSWRKPASSPNQKATISPAGVSAFIAAMLQGDSSAATYQYHRR